MYLYEHFVCTFNVALFIIDNAPKSGVHQHLQKFTA